MDNNIKPLVSIGLPVYNGEKSLSKAIDSILVQDYLNIELIISDNGSIDATQKICKKYELIDPRIKYYRSEINQGAAWNAENVLDLSSGIYFMWAAHDDYREPNMISACVEKLEKSPEAVLCQANTATYVEGRSELLCINNLNSFVEDAGVVKRYREALKNWPATAIYGLYRLSSINKTQKFKRILGGDLVFIQELSLHGKFIQVDEVLFSYNTRKTWNTVHQDYYAIFNKDKKPWWYIPFIILYLNHCKRINDSILPRNIKFNLFYVLLRNLLSEIIIKISIKIIGKVCPNILKEKLGIFLYWRWLHCSNVQVKCMDLYLDRIIKPRLGWWG